MKLIVGLGNPGKIYSYSRHNIGFSAVKALSKFYKVALKKDKAAFSLSAKCKIKNQNIILATPVTFMNLSGLAVKALLKKYRIDLENLLVVCDDLDLELGRQKIRASGSSGGHQGLKSVIDSLKSDRFSRLRIGIGRPQINTEVKDYVLSPFTQQERGQVKKIIAEASLCCRVWVREGVTKSMNIFNQGAKG